MKAIAGRWKTFVALAVAGSLLFLLMARMAVGGPSAAAQSTPSVVPASQPAHGPPPSNEIRDFPQLG